MLFCYKPPGYSYSPSFPASNQTLYLTGQANLSSDVFPVICHNPYQNTPDAWIWCCCILHFDRWTTDELICEPNCSANSFITPLVCLENPRFRNNTITFFGSNIPWIYPRMIKRSKNCIRIWCEKQIARWIHSYALFFIYEGTRILISIRHLNDL